MEGPEAAVGWPDVPQLRLSELDCLDRHGVQIQCIDSRDFVLGSQTNFNGPVTIISCEEVLKKGREVVEGSGERLVIEERVISQSAAMKVHRMAKGEENSEKAAKRTLLKSRRFLIFSLCIALAAPPALALPVFLTASNPSDSPTLPPCIALSDDICIYSPFPSGGRTSPPLPPKLQLPVPYLIVSQTYDEYCYEYSACVLALQLYQHNDTKPPCNFLVGGDGNVYEDCGWTLDTAPEGPLPSRSLSVCLMGDFVDDYPTYPQVLATKALIAFGVASEFVAKDYSLLAGNVSSMIHEILRKWPQFLERCLGEGSGPPLEPPESDVSIECLRSSEFVVGKQSNFNGPVTIITCTEASKGTEEGTTKLGAETIVIRDKVLASEENGEKDKTWGVKLKKWRNLLKKKGSVALVPLFLGVILLVTVTIALAVFFSTTANTSADTSPSFYSKAIWGGNLPKSVIQMRFPIPYVVVSHSVSPQCTSLASCGPLIRNMQSYHQGLNFADISYNFLVDSSGNIYEGRGWRARNPNGGFVNGRNIEVGLIGDYSDRLHPSQEMMQALQRLLEMGLEQKKISPTYALLAANSTYSTLSPGKNVYAIIKDWPHFDANPEKHIKEFE